MRFWDIIQWTIIAAIIVAVIMNIGRDVGAINAFASFWTKETGILTGTGYKLPS